MDITKLVNDFNPNELCVLQQDRRGFNNKQKLIRAIKDFVITLRCLMTNPSLCSEFTPELIVEDEFGVLPNGRLKILLVSLTKRALLNN